MTWPNIYVAAPFVDGPLVRNVHTQLVDARIRPTSSWVEVAHGMAESLENTPQHVRAAALEQNNRDIAFSDGMIFLARHGAGGEMFAELARALNLDIPVYWVGDRVILSTYHWRVRRCRDVADAIAKIHEDNQ